MNRLTEILRDSDAKNQLVDDLAAFACYVLAEVCAVGLFWVMP